MTQQHETLTKERIVRFTPSMDDRLVREMHRSGNFVAEIIRRAVEGYLKARENRGKKA